MNNYLKVYKETIVWIDTKYLYTLTECFVYFVSDTNIILFFFPDLRIIILPDDWIIA